MNTNELTGPALDWAVAKCEGYAQCVVFGRGAVRAEGLLRPHRLGGVDTMLLRPVHDEWVKKCEDYPWNKWQTIWEPSTDWSLGGPIIEREKMSLEWTGEDWMAYVKHDEEVFGPTPLIAAMRCFVASKLGDAIDIPDELTK